MNQFYRYRQYWRRAVAKALKEEGPDLFRQAKALQAELKKPDAYTPGLRQGTTDTNTNNDTVANRAGEGKP